MHQRKVFHFLPSIPHPEQWWQRLSHVPLGNASLGFRKKGMSPYFSTRHSHGLAPPPIMCQGFITIGESLTHWRRNIIRDHKGQATMHIGHITTRSYTIKLRSELIIVLLQYTKVKYHAPFSHQSSSREWINTISRIITKCKADQGKKLQISR